MGLIEGVEAWIESLAAIYELSPDVRTDELHTAAVAPDGRVSVGRMWGRNTEGGDFESNVVWLFLYRAGRVARIEVFEVEDLEAALARFEELRSD
jgi:ketosteroid isomerase-like protein